MSGDGWDAEHDEINTPLGARLPKIKPKKVVRGGRRRDCNTGVENDCGTVSTSTSLSGWKDSVKAVMIGMRSTGYILSAYGSGEKNRMMRKTGFYQPDLQFSVMEGTGQTIKPYRARLFCSGKRTDTFGRSIKSA